jgi:hypothetical protein
MLKISILILLVSQIFSLYDSNSKVVKLTKENFDRLVLKSNELWLVEFYAPWYNFIILKINSTLKIKLKYYKIIEIC